MRKYYIEHKEEIARKERDQYRKMIKEQGRDPHIYHDRKGFILSNDTETKFFATLKEAAEFLGVDKSTVYYRLYKAKKDRKIKGWDLDIAL